MLMVLQEAKEKFLFRFANFCIMPTHIHLLIEPTEGTSLSKIMQWIKTRSARRWNFIHGSTDHVWGDRYFARIVKNPLEFEETLNYIDQNPVKAGLAEKPADWKASGAFYREQGISGLVDFSFAECKTSANMLVPIKPLIIRLFPPKQLTHITKYLGVYAEAIERLCEIVKEMPKLEVSENTKEPPVYLHYFTKTADYFIYEYDGEDTMYGKIRFNVYPLTNENQKFSLAKLKKNQFLELDLYWVPDVK